MPPGESWSCRSAYTPMSTDKTTNSLQIPGPRETLPEPSGHRSQGTSDRILLLSVFTAELTLYHISSYLNPSQRELVSQEYWQTEVCRRDKHQSETTRPLNTRDNMMVKGKDKNASNRNQGYLLSSELVLPPQWALVTSAHQKNKTDLKPHLMMMIEDFKK